MFTWDNDAEFWSLVVRHGLPWFRFIRHSCPLRKVDVALRNHPDWDELRSKIQPDDEIWPFRFPRSGRYWGKKYGYVVLRRGQFLGGIITTVE